MTDSNESDTDKPQTRVSAEPCLALNMLTFQTRIAANEAFENDFHMKDHVN